MAIKNQSMHNRPTDRYGINGELETIGELGVNGVSADHITENPINLSKKLSNRLSKKQSRVSTNSTSRGLTTSTTKGLTKESPGSMKDVGGTLFNCTDLSKFIESIKRALPFRGYSMSRFYICEHNGLQFLTKMAFYNKTAPELYAAPAPTAGIAPVPHIDAEIGILKVFNRRFTKGNITPCVIELLYSKVCDGLTAITPSDDICAHLLPNYDTITPSNNVEQSLCHQKNLIEHGFAHDKIAFLVLDECDQSLAQWLRGYTGSPVGFSLLKSILFMVLHAFVMFRRAYPGFTHYDLHDDNILLKIDHGYSFDPHHPQFMVFNVDGATYSVPYFGIIPKVIDFGFSTLPEENIVSNVVADRIQMHFRVDHDIILLLYWIRDRLVSGRVQNADAALDLLSTLDPSGAHKHYNTRTIRGMNSGILSYEEMLKLSIWDGYRKHVPSKYVRHEYDGI